MAYYDNFLIADIEVGKSDPCLYCDNDGRLWLGLICYSILVIWGSWHFLAWAENKWQG